MKTLSERRGDDSRFTAEVLWYPKNKRYITRCYYENREVDELIFPTETEAEDCAEDFVLQGQRQGDSTVAGTDTEEPSGE